MKLTDLIELLKEYQSYLDKNTEIVFEAFEYKNLKPNENFIRFEVKNKKLIIELD
jgi:predicted RNA-binding protein with PIN domain